MLREMYSYWRDKKPTDTFREFHEEVKNDWDELYPSLLDDILTIDEYIEGDYLRHDGKLWSSEKYCETLEGTFSHVDDTYWCEYMNEPSDETFTVYIDRHEYQYSKRGIEKHGSLYEYRGDYYDNDALSRHDLVVMYNGEIEDSDNAYWHESDGEYYYEPEEEEESYTRDYHSYRNQEKIIFTKAPQFFIGIEVEKEDQTVKESISIGDFEDQCPGYKKERDGSLDDESGFEMVTPPYELVPDKIMEHIKANEVLVDHFNASHSYSCGGHVNLSEEGLSGEELFSKLKGYNPLLYALYHKRIDKNYCKGKSNHDLKSENEKYQAVKIHDNRIEYRLVSAVHDLNTLEWRLKLFELITKYPTACPKVAFYFVHTKLKKHLKKMYPDTFDTLVERIISMTDKFEQVKL
jgi:hypothetical protein